MRRFQLHRDQDETGVSGTGIVAEGCQFTSGNCAMTWFGMLTSVAFYADIVTVEKIHGHNGRTRFVWLDGEGKP